MADESQYNSGADATATNKRKYDDQTPPPPTRRATGFSSPDSAHAPQSYNNVPPPADEIQMAKQKAQEIAARLLSGADIKRPRVENGSSGFDSMDKGFSSSPGDMKSLSNAAPSAIPVSYGSYLGSSTKKIEIPNGRVGVIIGRGGETIKYLQIQSGAKIQVTRDMDSDPGSTVRIVELMGTPEQIAKAEQLINEVLSEADAGGSGTVSRRFTGQGGSDTFVMKIANNKVGLVIGKGGETIKNMQTKSGARIQVIPLHLPPGDTSTERNVHIEGTSEQIEFAKQLVIEVTSENRARNPSMGGGYPQQGYQARPQTSWSQPGATQAQQPGYGYAQAGAYPAPSPQYNMSQPPYTGYPPQPSSGGYPSNWDQSNASATQQTGQGYDYYSQQASSQQPAPAGSAAQADGTVYNYGQPAASGYNHQGQGYAHDGYGGYTQSGYGQPPAYDQQQGYAAPSYGNAAGAAQEGHTPPYGAQGETTQAPSQPPAMGQQGYATGQQPQGTTQPGYGVPPTSQAGYGSQPPAQPGYGSSYGAPPGNPPAHGQAQQSPTTAAGAYSQPGYAASGYAQPESNAQRTSSGYNATGAQPGYGAAYGGQSGYGQGVPPYNTYSSGYSQPAAAAYSADGNGTSQGGVAKTSPQS